MATRLRKRVAEILQTEHRVSQTRLGSLGAKDRAELRAIAGGARLPELRVKAMSVLAASRDPASSEVFRQALADPSAGPEIRAAGATWLSRVGGMAVEGALLDSLAIEEQPIVQHKLVAGLARVGTDASLRHLQTTIERTSPAVREHAEFARSVVAFRNHVPGFELPVLDAAARLPASGALDPNVRMSTAQPEVALRIVEQTLGDSFGVVADHDGMALLQCGRRQLATVMDQQLRGSVQELLSRPAILGLVAVQAETDLSYATSLIILSWPDAAGALHVSVNRLTGRPMYAGEIKVDGDALRFTLDAVRGPGATETSVTGTLVRGRVEALEVVSGRTIERMRPTPMEDR
jgi:hypothetical protein